MTVWTWHVTASYDMWQFVTVMCDVTLTPNFKSKNKIVNWNEIEIEKRNKNN